MINLILKYFPDLTEKQIEQFTKVGDLYKEWNNQINVVSRKDIDEIYTNHILHSLAIAKVMEFADGTSVLDVGTGGGLPGIPLAILFPNVQFHLVDSIGKKIKVVQGVADGLGLTNVKEEKKRAEENFVFIKSWNEWAEGAHLEPDLRYGLQWLEAVQRSCQSG